MRGIAEFLEKFQRMAAPERAVREVVIAAVRDILGYELAEKQISVRRGTVRLSVSAVVKSEIQLHKKEILDLMRARGGAAVREIV